MNIFSAMAVLLGCLVFLPVHAAAECTKDTDCKGTRICQDGRCVYPPATPPPGSPSHDKYRPTSKQRTPTTWFNKGYGVLSGLLVPHSWGKMTVYSGAAADQKWDISSGFMGGFRIAGYYIFRRIFHGGGYFYYMGGKEKLRTELGTRKEHIDNIGVGFSIKVGKPLANTVWLGFAYDMGVPIVLMDGLDSYGVGVALFPRFELDVVVFRAKDPRISIFGSIGPLIEIRIKGAKMSRIEWNDAKNDMWAWAVRLAFLVGITVGG